MDFNVRKVRKDTGKNIKIARIRMDMKQRELAKASGLNIDHVGKLERGEIPVRVEHILVLAKALNCEACSLLPK